MKTVVFRMNLLAGIALFFIFENDSGKRKLCFIGTGITDYLISLHYPAMRRSYLIFNAVSR